MSGTGIFKSKLLRAVALLFVAVAAFLLLVVVNNIWIDSQDVNGTPNRSLVRASTAVWSVTPTFDQRKDVGRLIKLSWLNVGSLVYGKGRKLDPRIKEVIVDEALRLTDYLERHGAELDEELRDALFLKVLTYFNRADVLNGTLGISAFGKQVDVFFNSRRSGNDEQQEDWLWEISIRHRISGSDAEYRHDIDQLRELSQKNHGGNLPSEFLDGAIDLHEGMLACIVREQVTAEPLLRSASEKLSNYGPYLAVFITRDLNVFLLGKGMGSGGVCNTLIQSIISLGA